MKELYHIICSQTEAIIWIRQILDKENIENYVGFGGIHVHVSPNQLNKAIELSHVFSKQLIKGMLPNAQKEINSLFKTKVEINRK